MEEPKFDFRKLQEADVPKRYIRSPEEKENAKYGKLVFAFPQERNEIVAEGDPEDYVVKPQAYFRGASQIPGAEFNQSYQIFVKPFFLDRIQHRHVRDEYLIFLGASFPNVFDFEARIEFTMGKGEDAETYIITQPTIIRVPAGVYHCPLNFKEVNKPVLFLATLFTPTCRTARPARCITTARSPASTTPRRSAIPAASAFRRPGKRTDARGQIMPCQAPDLGII